MSPATHNDRVKGRDDVHISMRMPRDLLADVDEYAARLEAEKPGARFSRGDAIRVLLKKGLASS